MDIKEDIRKESCSLDFCEQNESKVCSEEFLRNVKYEPVTSGSDCDVDIKSEIEEEDVISNFNSQYHREFISGDSVTGDSKGSKDSIFEPKVEIKEEQCSVKTTLRENLCIYDDIEDETEELNDVETPRLYKEVVSSCTSHILSNEDQRNDGSLNVINNSCQCTTTCKSQDSDVTNTPTLQASVYSDMPNSGENVGKTTCLKQNNLLQQSNINKQHINKDNCKSTFSSEIRKPHKCKVCGKCFKFASHLKKHSMIHDDKKIKCDICEKGFNHLSCLKGHKLIHEGKKPHKCDTCDKAFTDLNNLKRHKLIHEGKKPYKCDICENTFTQSQHLNRHKLIHDSKKSYSCDICYKAFTHLTNLKTHKFIHEGKKPYKCDICEKTFTQSAHLKRHKLIHEDVKPYKCDICNKPFTDLSNLKKHKWIHEDKKPYWCNTCKKAFNRLHHLKAHKCNHASKKPH